MRRISSTQLTTEHPQRRLFDPRHCPQPPRRCAPLPVAFSRFLVLLGHFRSLLHAPASPLQALSTTGSIQWCYIVLSGQNSLKVAFTRFCTLSTAPDRFPSLPIAPTPSHTCYTSFTTSCHRPHVSGHYQLVSASLCASHCHQLHSVGWQRKGMVHETRVVGCGVWKGR